MIPGLDIAAAGMKARLDQQEVIANNLANVTTEGFKRRSTAFRGFQQVLAAAADTPTPPSSSGMTPRLVTAEDESPCVDGSSNVNTVQEMIQMIEALRAYESCQKSIQSIDGTLDKVINQMQK